MLNVREYVPWKALIGIRQSTVSLNQYAMFRGIVEDGCMLCVYIWMQENLQQYKLVDDLNRLRAV